MKNSIVSVKKDETSGSYITSFIITENSLWIGTQNGYLYIYSINSKSTNDKASSPKPMATYNEDESDKLQFSFGGSFDQAQSSREKYLQSALDLRNREMVKRFLERSTSSISKLNDRELSPFSPSTPAIRRHRMEKSKSLSSLDKIETIFSSISNSLSNLFVCNFEYKNGDPFFDRLNSSNLNTPTAEPGAVVAKPLAISAGTKRMNFQTKHESFSNSRPKLQTIFSTEAPDSKPTLIFFNRPLAETRSDSIASFGVNAPELVIDDLELFSKVKLSDKPIRSLARTRREDKRELVISCTGNYGDDETVLVWKQNSSNVSFCLNLHLCISVSPLVELLSCSLLETLDQ